MKARKLDRLQQNVLSAFFGKEKGFFLTGGAALVGFHLGHRQTQDLDLFTGEKPLVGGIRVDPRDEILANKLCALLSRAEIRDLVDVWAIEKAGYVLEEKRLRRQRGKTVDLRPGNWHGSYPRSRLATTPPSPAASPPRSCANT